MVIALIIFMWGEFLTGHIYLDKRYNMY